MSLSMLFLLTFLTATYFAVVLWVRRRSARQVGPVVAEAPELPAEDRPPSSAVGWPPGGRHFTTYVDQGFAELDAYLSEGFAA
ncbi:MAG: hypothetical protein ACRDWY_00330 [Actinomycetes bacterium]